MRSLVTFRHRSEGYDSQQRRQSHAMSTGSARLADQSVGAKFKHTPQSVIHSFTTLYSSELECQTDKTNLSCGQINSGQDVTISKTVHIVKILWIYKRPRLIVSQCATAKKEKPSERSFLQDLKTSFEFWLIANKMMF